MRTSIKTFVVGSLLLLGGAGCADLEVMNLNDPDAARALATPGDVESLIGGAFNTWYTGIYNYSGASMYLSNQAFQHNAPWANSAMEAYGRIPRISTVNSTSDSNYGNLARIWTYAYRAIAATADGLRALDNPDTPEIPEELGAEKVAALKAYGKFVQALGHAALASYYDGGFVVTEETDLLVEQEFIPYNELMDVALGLFDEAIALCGTSFTLEPGWINQLEGSIDNNYLKEIIYSYKASFRANVPRTPAEAQSVDWSAVITEVDNGITDDFMIYADRTNSWMNGAIYYCGRPDWGQLGNYVHGMVDTSGVYQEWLALTDLNKSYRFDDGRDVLFHTPDLRYPQGADLEEQRDNPGTLYRITRPQAENTFQKPDRGTWRWSWYKHGDSGERYQRFREYNVPEMRYSAMQMLKAEALFRQGQQAAAVPIINTYREAAGLSATDASGTNTSCVPRLPSGECGDLWEMLKWERRQASVLSGFAVVQWFWDSRRWGDLYYNTPLHTGMPCREAQVLQMEPCMDYGGGLEFSAAKSTYQYPYEGG